MQSSPEDIMAGVFELEDMGCEAQKFALVRVEEIISRWAVAQPTSPERALHLPVARFMYTFCTLLWPIELMGESCVLSWCSSWWNNFARGPSRLRRVPVIMNDEKILVALEVRDKYRVSLSMASLEIACPGGRDENRVQS
jgi:hypothetical protein